MRSLPIVQADNVKFYLLTIDTIINNNRKDFIIEGWIAHTGQTRSLSSSSSSSALLMPIYYLFFLSLCVTISIVRYARSPEGNC